MPMRDAAELLGLGWATSISAGYKSGPFRKFTLAHICGANSSWRCRCMKQSYSLRHTAHVTVCRKLFFSAWLSPGPSRRSSRRKLIPTAVGGAPDGTRRSTVGTLNMGICAVTANYLPWVVARDVPCTSLSHGSNSGSHGEPYSKAVRIRGFWAPKGVCTHASHTRRSPEATYAYFSAKQLLHCCSHG